MQRLARFMPDMFTRLIILAVILASLLPVTGQAAVVLGWATKLAIALLFFLHGARLSREVVIAGALHWRLHLVILGTTFVLFPILGWGMGFIPESVLPPGLYMGMLFICVLPSTVQSSIAFTSVAGGNVAAAICAASASNIFGMVLTPLLVGLMMTATGSAGFSLSILGQIFLQLLLPFVLGQIAQPWVGNWVRARKKLLAPVDRGSVLMVVYLAFSEAMAEGMWSRYSLHDIGTVVVADALLLALVLVITAFGGKAMGFSREDRIAILFCGSKKSMASGVPMASVIFAGQAIGPIVLPLMLFHQIQLMVCSVLAQRYADQNRRAEAEAEAAARLQGA